MVEKKNNLKRLLIFTILLFIVSFSFWKIDFNISAFFDSKSVVIILDFIREFFPPNLEKEFVFRVFVASWETFAMSIVSTFFAGFLGLLIALPASNFQKGPTKFLRNFCRIVLNILRSIPELVWAALLIISAGLGPFTGTLALLFHTTGILGRLMAESIENVDKEPSMILSANGVNRLQIFFYSTLPQLLPQFMSYILYRWENNIRVATVLGVVGAGGLGQMLNFNLSLFLMDRSCTVIIAMILLVLIVDFFSGCIRKGMTQG